MEMRKLFVPAIAAGVMLGLVSTASAMVIKSADVHPMDYPTVQAVLYMGDLLSQWTNGRLTIKVFPSMQLGGEKESLEQCQLGALEMTRVSVGVVGPIVPEFDAFNLPYFFRGVKHMQKVVDGEIGTGLLNKLESGGLIGLGYMDAGSRSFFNKFHPINKPSDLKGMKIRVMQNPIFVDMVNALGGNGIQISYSELYTALQTGVVDGAENNPPSLYNEKFYEVAKYYSLDRHLIVPEIFVFSKKVWDTMSTTDHELIRKASAFAVVRERELWAKKEKADMANLRKVGAVINEVKDVTPFIKMTQSVRDEFKKRGPKFAKLIDAVAAVK